MPWDRRVQDALREKVRLEKEASKDADTYRTRANTVRGNIDNVKYLAYFGSRYKANYGGALIIAASIAAHGSDAETFLHGDWVRVLDKGEEFLYTINSSIKTD